MPLDPERGCGVVWPDVQTVAGPAIEVRAPNLADRRKSNPIESAVFIPVFIVKTETIGRGWPLARAAGCLAFYGAWAGR